MTNTKWTRFIHGKCVKFYKRSCRIWRLNSPLLTALLSHFQHGQCTKFNAEQFYGGFYSRTFAVFKLCRRLCGNRGNPNNRIWAPGEIKLVKIRKSNSESWRHWALGSIHSMARSAHPLLYPSIHQFIYWPTYQHIPEERIWIQENLFWLSGLGLVLIITNTSEENPFDFPGTPLTGQHSGGSLFNAVELRNAS